MDDWDHLQAKDFEHIMKRLDDLVRSGDDLVGRCEVEDGGLAAGAGVQGEVLACASGVVVELAGAV